VSDLPVGPYLQRPVEIRPWDARSPAVAARIAGAVRVRRPDLVVEHVGSSAVPGLPGKGVIDLAIAADASAIPSITADLLTLGFRPQPGPAAWPITRPMLMGSIEHEGEPFNIHLHLMPRERGELAEMTGFRDRLRADADLRAAYVAAKEGAVVDGPALTAARPTPGNQGYAMVKGRFVEDALLATGVRAAPADRGPALPPGATIGVLGGGQLGRMLGIAARALGYRMVILDPDPDCPARAVADRQIVAAYDDVEAALGLVTDCAVVTYELEHVSAAVVEALAERLPVRPGLRPLRVTQDRLAERRFLRGQGELTADWREVRDPASLLEAGEALGYPLRLKTPIGGYDGRSQVRLAGPDDCAPSFERLAGPGGERPLLVERELDFLAELSVVCARGMDGRVVAFPVARNVHDGGILVESVAPAALDPIVADVARDIAGGIARALDVVGMLTVELFLLEDGQLAVNELAPRVHNSGHYTIEACATSQFEQHVRAICGLPLGSSEQRSPAAMVNLLGEGPGRPGILEGVADALADPAVHLHVYDKRLVFSRRKMGHLTALDASADTALERARAARARLRWAD
jgi:5-(carboxyamino)imidazole ribonucleotide synthase